MGHISGYETAGVQYVKIVAVIDSKTTPICRAMNGKVFKVAEFRKQYDKIIHAAAHHDLKAYKAAQPMVSGKAMSGEISDEDIKRLGIKLPPYHFRCRTTHVAYFENEPLKTKETKPENFTNYLKTEVKKPDFKEFLKGNSVEKQKIIGVLNSNLSEVIKEKSGTNANTVFLSRETLLSHQPGGANNTHSEIGLSDFQNLPEALYNPDTVLYTKRKDKDYYLFYTGPKEKSYEIVVKLTADKKEFYLVTYHRGNVRKNAEKIYEKQKD